MHPRSLSLTSVSLATARGRAFRARGARTIAAVGASLWLLAGSAIAAGGRNHSKDLVETAQAAGSFGTLIQALDAADLVETLQGPGPFTVFAPTDEAFGKLPKATLNALLEPDNRQALVDVLTYHVVSGRVDSAAAVAAREADTLAKESVRIAIEDGQLKINQARVVANDISTSNGIIHVLDEVLVPQRVVAALAENSGRKVIGVYVERPSRALAAQLDLARDEALVVTGLTRSGNARSAGLEEFDVITTIDGRPATSRNLDRAKSERGVGGQIHLGVVRAGRELDLSVPVGVARH